MFTTVVIFVICQIAKTESPAKTRTAESARKLLGTAGLILPSHRSLAIFETGSQL